MAGVQLQRLWIVVGEEERWLRLQEVLGEKERWLRLREVLGEVWRTRILVQLVRLQRGLLAPLQRQVSILPITGCGGD